MNNARTAVICIESYTLYPDGSGCPSVVSCAGYMYACDFLNGVRLSCIGHASGSRTGSKIAADRVRAWFANWIETHTTAEWRELNAQMYAA